MSHPKSTPDLKADPYRKDFILDHRKVRNSMFKMAKSTVFLSDVLAINPMYMPHGLAEDWEDFPEIFLKEMDKTEELVYNGSILVLTIIDDPMLGFSSVNFVTEDENKDVIRLSVYGLPHNQSTCEKFAFGTLISIMNPYLRIATDGKFGIRVDEPESISHLGRKKDMCRYCGQENAAKQCADCKRTYCNRHCQKEDWKYLKHKLVCKTPIGWSVQTSVSAIGF